MEERVCHWTSFRRLSRWHTCLGNTYHSLNWIEANRLYCHGGPAFLPSASCRPASCRPASCRSASCRSACLRSACHPVLHAVLTAALIAGVLFSSTRIQHMAILSTLLILLFGIRMNQGCCATTFEGQPTLTQLGKALYLQHDNPSLSDKTFEEILVSNLTFLQLLRVAALSFFPVKYFEGSHEHGVHCDRSQIFPGSVGACSEQMIECIRSIVCEHVAMVIPMRVTSDDTVIDDVDRHVQESVK